MHPAVSISGHRFLCSTLIGSCIYSLLVGMEAGAQPWGSIHRNSSSVQQGKKIALVSALPASGPSRPTLEGNEITLVSQDSAHFGAETVAIAPPPGTCHFFPVGRWKDVWLFKICKILLKSLSWVPNIFVYPQVIQADKLWKGSQIWEENIFSCLKRQHWKFILISPQTPGLVSITAQ